MLVIIEMEKNEFYKTSELTDELKTQYFLQEQIQINYKEMFDKLMLDIYRSMGMKGALSECAGICARSYWEYERRDNEIIGLA